MPLPDSPVSAVVSRPSEGMVWWLAARPRTLTVSLSPILVGSALAWREAEAFVPWVFWVTVLAALAIQIGTNLHNDAADFELGTDTKERLGPPRVAAMGWVRPSRLRQAAWGCFALAFLLGSGLVARGGWPIVGIGLASLLAGWAYTGGRHPIAYSPFGEVFVLFFFGVAALAGTTYLHTLTVSLPAVVAGLALGGLAAGVITVNNHRDRVGDQRAGRRTLAILLGQRGTLGLYGLEVLASFALLPVLSAMVQGGWSLLLPLLLLPSALVLLRRCASGYGSRLNAVLGGTALLQVAYAALLSAGLLL